MSIKQTFNDIDIQLGAMPKNNRAMIYASVAFVILGFSYYVFGISLMEDNEAKNRKITSLQSNISKVQPTLFKELILKENKRRLELAQVYEDEKYKSTALRVKLEGMDYLSADERGLADILDRILKKSVELRINIDNIAINDIHDEVTTQIKKRGSMIIKGTAPFYSVQKLLSFIESQESLLLVDHIYFDLNEEKKNPYPSFEITLIGYEVVI